MSYRNRDFREIIELEMTNFDSMSAIFKTLYLALIKFFLN